MIVVEGLVEEVRRLRWLNHGLQADGFIIAENSLSEKRSSLLRTEKLGRCTIPRDPISSMIRVVRYPKPVVGALHTLSAALSNDVSKQLVRPNFLLASSHHTMSGLCVFGRMWWEN